MKYYGVTTTYNCAKILPYVMKYYEDWSYDRLIVYDNESSDETVELLKNYSFVEIRTFPHIICDTFENKDKFDLSKKEVLLNGLWDIYREHVGKTEGYVEGKTEFAWITLTDFDEVPYFYSVNDKRAHKDAFFNEITGQGYNILNENMLNLFKDSFPEENGKFLHEQAESCAYGCPYYWKKPILFRLDNLCNVNLYLGEHFGWFKFFGQKPKSLSNTKNFHMFHLKFAFGDNNYRIWHGSTASNTDCTISLKSYFEYKMLHGVNPNEDEFVVREMQ